MRRAALALTLLTLVAPASARATHANYRGECHLAAHRAASALHPTDHWSGVVWVDVVATDSSANRVPTTAPIRAWCELRVNGTSQGTVAGPAQGTGQAHDADTVEFDADYDDVVSVCDHVTVDGDSLVQCGDATRSLLPPPVRDVVRQVCDATGGMCGTIAVTPTLFMYK